jgi:hypothetical protein
MDKPLVTPTPKPTVWIIDEYGAMSDSCCLPLAQAVKWAYLDLVPGSAPPETHFYLGIFSRREFRSGAYEGRILTYCPWCGKKLPVIDRKFKYRDTLKKKGADHGGDPINEGEASPQDPPHPQGP